MPQEYIWATNATCKGVNNTAPDFSIDDAELSDSANYQPDFTGQGWMIKREGITKTDTTQRTATTYSIYDGMAGNYYHNGTVVRDFAGTSLDTGIAQAYDSWTSMGGYDIYANGTDIRKTLDGTTFSALSGVAAGTKYLAAANNFLYGAGHTSNPYEILYASWGTVETWSAVYSLVFTEEIKGIKKCVNALGIWAAKAFYMVMGYSNIDQEVSYYSEQDGLVGSNASIVTTPYGTFWWGPAGITWMKSGYEIDHPMHRKLAKTLYGLNRAYDSLVHAVWDASQQRVMFWLVNGAGTTVNLRVDYYPYYDAFYIHTGAGVCMSASASVIVSGAQNIYVGGYNPTYLYKHGSDSLTDNGTAITGYFDTKNEGQETVQRSARKVILATNLAGTETITYSDYVDNATSANATYNLSITAGQQDTVIALNHQNTRLKHRVTDAATATRTKILKLSHTGTADKVK
jgi:hypothetical protein